MRVASLVTAGLLTLAGNFGADAQIVLPERGLREMSAEAQQFQYERKVIPLEGGRFGWIAAKGDLNHDGVPDLVSIAHNGSLQLAVWLSNGAGSYQSASHMYAVPSRFMDPKVVDVNKDGHLDVAGAEQLPGPNASKVLIFLGDGSGMLRAPVVTEVKGANPDFADFNADGKVDAVVAEKLESRAFIWGWAMGALRQIRSRATIPRGSPLIMRATLTVTGSWISWELSNRSVVTTDMKCAQGFGMAIALVASVLRR